MSIEAKLAGVVGQLFGQPQRDVLRSDVLRVAVTARSAALEPGSGGSCKLIVEKGMVVNPVILH